jgi:hypothetical protein
MILPAGRRRRQPQSPRASDQQGDFLPDGMRPDMMEKYAAAGEMPTFANPRQAGG